MKKIVAILLAVLMVLAMSAVAEERLYIPVMAKGFQHQFWQTVAAGAQKAAEDYNVDIYFDGPASETNIDEQVEMLKSEMAKNPKAIALAALSTDAVMAELQECVEKGIPVIGFDSGVPGAPEGAIKATASTNNENAAAIAAEKMMEQEGFADMLKAATAENPVVIAVISQEAVSGSIVGRTTGFVNKMVELASEYNTVSVTGHDLWKNEVEGAGVIVHVQISATTEATDVATASNAVLNMDGLKAVFLLQRRRCDRLPGRHRRRLRSGRGRPLRRPDGRGLRRRRNPEERRPQRLVHRLRHPGSLHDRLLRG